jgi:Flp pilus assembly protein TadG
MKQQTTEVAARACEGRRYVKGRKRGEEGFSLVMIAVCAVVMVAMVGLAFDLGRMFIVRNELQTFVDASARAACRQMAGSEASMQVAHSTATGGPLPNTPNGWNFDTNTISNVTDTYATTFNGTYDSYATASGGTTNTYSFIKVTANATTPLYFLAVIPGVPTSQLLQATATAGQKAQSAVGLGPFMPDAHNSADTTHFGFVAGTAYTLKWGSGPGGNGTTTCGGDVGWTDPNPSSQHGFMDLGQGNGNSSLTNMIVYGGFPNANSTPSSISAGTTLGGDPGNRGASVFSALEERSGQDPDQTSTTYDQYVAAGIGNGRRIVTFPIGDPTTWSGNGNGTETVIGFANFLLDPASIISGSSGPICATYIGLGSLNGGGSGGTDGTKVYSVTLYQ